MGFGGTGEDPWILVGARGDSWQEVFFIVVGLTTQSLVHWVATIGWGLLGNHVGHPDAVCAGVVFLGWALVSVPAPFAARW